MDTAVAAYLLDPSTGDYGLEAVVAAMGGAEVEAAPETPVGQLDLDGPPAEVAVPAAAEAALVGSLVGPLRGRLAEEGLLTLHDEVELPPGARAGQDGGRGDRRRHRGFGGSAPS